MLVHVVSGMFFARVLTVADYGTYLQTFLAYDFAVPILTLGMPSALYYFLPREKERKKGLVLDNLAIMFLSGLGFSLFLLLGGTELLANRFNNPELSRTLRWMIFYPLYTFPVLMCSAVWVSQDKVKLNAKYNVFTGLILAITLIISVMLTRSYEAPILVRIFLPLVFLPIAVYLIFKYVPGKWSRPNILSMFKLAKFAIPLGLASVFGTLAIQLAGIIVSFLTSPEQYALYANGAKEVPFVGIVTGSISVVIMADMAKNIENGELSKALELFRKAASISASFLFPIMIFLMFYSESFIEILYSSKYAESVLPFRIYLLMIPIRIAYYGSAFIALGMTKSILYRSIVDLILTVILCYLFVLSFGANGAALGLLLTTFLWTVPFNLYSLSRRFNCSPLYMLPFNTLLRILIISIISAILPALLLLFDFNAIFEFAIGFFIYTVVYTWCSYLYLVDFREIIQPYLVKIPYLKSLLIKI
jgi:O-antigen/teichoic acid export membrane protein